MKLFQINKCKECNSQMQKVICCFLPVELCINDNCLTMTGVFVPVVQVLTEVSIFLGRNGFILLVYEGPYSRAIIDYIKTLANSNSP